MTIQNRQLGIGMLFPFDLLFFFFFAGYAISIYLKKCWCHHCINTICNSVVPLVIGFCSILFNCLRQVLNVYILGWHWTCGNHFSSSFQVRGLWWLPDSLLLTQLIAMAKQEEARRRKQLEGRNWYVAAEKQLSWRVSWKHCCAVAQDKQTLRSHHLVLTIYRMLIFAFPFQRMG